MTVGAVYGYTDSTAEERRAWILSILAFGEEAAEEFAALVGAIGITRLARDNSIGSAMAGVVGGDAMTVDALRRVNSRLATHVVARYGSRRGAVTLGKLLPFGIGAVVGGGATWTMARAVAKHCRGFFDRYHLTVAPPPPRLWPSPLPPPPPSLPSGTDPS